MKVLQTGVAQIILDADTLIDAVAQNDEHRQLLGSLGLTSGMLVPMREGELSERNQRTLHSIHEQARRLNRLIGSLLDISRIETGQLQLELASVELGDLTQSVVAALQPTLEQHQLVLERPAQPLVVIGEALRLEQVLHNLISNAIKYSPGGGLIRMQVLRCNNAGVIAVSDQGMGILEEALPHLFQRFYRAPTLMGSLSAAWVSGCITLSTQFL